MGEFQFTIDINTIGAFRIQRCIIQRYVDFTAEMPVFFDCLPALIEPVFQAFNQGKLPRIGNRTVHHLPVVFTFQQENPGRLKTIGFIAFFTLTADIGSQFRSFAIPTLLFPGVHRPEIPHDFQILSQIFTGVDPQHQRSNRQTQTVANSRLNGAVQVAVSQRLHAD